MLYDQCKNCYLNLNQKESIICEFDNTKYQISELKKRNCHCAAQEQIYLDYDENYIRKKKLLSIDKTQKN